MEERRSSLKQPIVISRSSIPTSEQGGAQTLEVRPFAAHEILNEVILKSDVEMSWTFARPEQNVAPRSHPLPSLLVVLEGSAELTGSLQRPIEKGAVVTVPAGQEYGFRAVGASGLHVLQVSFRNSPTGERVLCGDLAQLMSRNETRMQQTLGNPFFLKLQSGQLADPRRRAALRAALRVFSDAFQYILFTRQATCRDERFAGAFHEHLKEELGHNELLKVSSDLHADQDPILRAASAWFCHQMLLLDNPGKAIVNLVLETAGYHFHTLASRALAEDESAYYFRVHAEDDAEHMKMGMESLRDLHPETYRKLYGVLEDAWDMLGVVNERFAAFIDAQQEERTS